MITNSNRMRFHSLFGIVLLTLPALLLSAAHAADSDFEWVEYNDPTTGTGLLPRFEWACGCSPTAAAMVLGYWDNYGPTGGGNFGKFTAYGRLIDYYVDEDTLESYQGSDGVNFYWQSSGSYPVRPMLIVDLAWAMDTTGGGSTSRSNQAPGINEVVNSKGYGNSWAHRDWEVVDVGICWGSLKGEIDAERPIMVSIPNHSVCCYGYSETLNKFATHDPNYSTRQDYDRGMLDNSVIKVDPENGNSGEDVDLKSPDGGEDWEAGTAHTISWYQYSGGSIDNVDIYYSSNGGKTFSAIETWVSTSSGWNYYTWNIPGGIDSTRMRIKIRGWDGGSACLSEDGSQENFSVSQTFPSLAYSTHTIDDDTSGGSNGNGDGQVNPGETIETVVTLQNRGSGDAHNVSAELSTSDSYVTISDSSESYGDIAAGGSAPCTADYDFTVSSSCPDGHVITFNLAITADEGSWSDSFTVTVHGSGPSDDAYEENDTLATAYDFTSERTWLSTIAGLGVQADDDWYEINVSPSGYERVQVDCRFTDADGDIDIALYDAAGNWLADSAGISDNEFIDYVVPSAGTYYIQVYYADAGNTYDLWWDDLPSATPEPSLSYQSHTIDDDSSGGSIGNGDGQANPGETIETVVTLQNTGSADAHNVSAELSTSDSYVTISDSSESYGDIVAGGSAPCSADYDFTVSSGCPDGHVISFDLAITADEGTWSDSFTVTVYSSGPTDDAYEENDTLATAYDFTSEGTWLSTIGGHGVQADDDWYEINVSPSGYERVQVDCRFADADGDIDIQLVDASGTVLASSTGTSDDEFIDHIVPSAGTYYIRVYYGDAGNTYDLWWDDMQPPSQAISGNIETSGGSGISGVSVSADNGGGTDTTDSSGFYSLTVPYNWSGSVTPSKNGYTFNPSSRGYSGLTSNESDEDYAGVGPPFRILQVFYSPTSGFSITWTCEVGYSYQVQYSETMNNADWHSIGPAQEPTAGETQLNYTDASAVGAAKRFYRVARTLTP